MDIKNSISKTISRVGASVMKTYDTAKVELKIKNYSKENKMLFMELGQLVYDARKKNIPLNENYLEEIISSIEGVSSRIKHLEKHLADIKNQKQLDAKITIDKELKGYARLNKKEDDLIITRTEQGIAPLRFCPQCAKGNDANTNICVNCGYELIRN